MHAIAAMAGKVRGKPGSYGLVTANGGYLSKHATGIYSTTPTRGVWRRESPASYQAEIDAMESPEFTRRRRARRRSRPMRFVTDGTAPSGES